MRTRVLSLAACTLLLIAFAVIAWFSQQNKCATFDEPLHFMGAWVQTHYNDFRVNPEDPPLWKFYLAAGTDKSALQMDTHSGLWNMMLENIPAPALNYAIQTLYQTPHNPAHSLLQAARARMLLLAIILGIAIAWWAWRLAGPLAAVVATAAFTLDPNFLAHSPLIKNDVTITLLFVLILAAVWIIGERATLLRCSILALLVGAALTTKFSGLLAFPMIAIALTCRILIGNPWPFIKWTLQSRRAQTLAAVAILLLCIIISYAFIWTCYGFRFSPSADSKQHFDYSLLTEYCAENDSIANQNPPPIYPTNSDLSHWVNQWQPTPTVRAVQIADRAKFLPEAWLYGFLYTYGSSLARRGFLLGNLSIVGWWYYFPLAILFKTPLATLIAIPLAIIVSRKRRTSSIHNWWPIAATLVGPIFYMAVAMRAHLDIGLRHTFPVYPFLFIFLGVSAATAYRHRPKLTAWIISLLFLGLVIETTSAFPDFIPFFNAIAGGPRGGLSLLGDSNLDWGQDLPALADWQRDHPDRQLYLSRQGSPDPRYYGLHYIELPGSQISEPDQIAPSGQLPIYAISAANLQGPYLTQEQRQFYQHFLKEKPAAILHGTIYLYDKIPQ
jgi:hypothetical protein